jgi:hypothetical protein
MRGKIEVNGGKKRGRAFLHEEAKNVQVVLDYPYSVYGFNPS